MYTSKQPFLKSKQPFSKSKQTFNKSKQPFRKSKQTFRKFKQPFRKSKQPFRRRPRIGPGDRIDYRNMSLINRFIINLETTTINYSCYKTGSYFIFLTVS